MADGPVNTLLHQLRRWSGSTEAEETDSQLLERFLAKHDEPAFTALVRRHGPMVFGVCRRVLHYEQDAEDAFQATFLVLARKASSLRRHRSLGGWLHEVAYHLALRAKEKAMRRQQHEREVRPMTPSDGPLLEASWRELRSLLDEELRQLPPKHREPLILCYLEGKTNEQAARQLGWPLGSMSRRLEHGRELLRRRLVRRGVTLSVGALSAALIEEAASAAVPPLLAASVVRMMLQTSAASIPATVSALVAGGIHEMALSKLRITLLLTLTAVGFSAGALVYRTIGKQPIEQQSGFLAADMFAIGDGIDPPAEEQPSPPAKVAEKQTRTDMYGDPLPPGALVRLGTVRLRHVRSRVAFSPDGKTVISAGDDGSVRYWEPVTGKEVRRVQLLTTGRLFLNTLAADGKTIAACTADGIRVWDTATGEEQKRFPIGSVRLPGLENVQVPVQVFRLALSPDGKKLAADLSNINEHTVHVWNVSTGKKFFALKVQQASNSLVFSPDGKLLGTVAFDEVLRLWDTATGKEIRTIADAQNCLTFSPDGKRAAAVSRGGGVKVWNMADGKECFDVKPIPRLYPISLAFASDNKTLAISFPEKFYLYDVAAGKQLRSIPEYEGGLVFSPDGKSIAGSGTAIHVWDVATGKEIGRHAGHESAVTSLAIEPNGGSVAAFDMTPRFHLWDTASGRPLLHPSAHKSYVRSGAFSPDGRFLVTGGGDTILRSWDCKTGAEVRKFTFEARDPALGTLQVVALALSSDGERLASLVVTGERITDFQLHVWNFATGKRLAERMLKFVGFEVRFSPDARSMANQRGKEVVVADTVTGQEIVKVAGRAPLAFSPDGQILALANLQPKPLPPGTARPAGGAPGEVDSVCLVELTTGKKLLRIETGSIGHNLLAYAPDGRTLATADRDSFRIWDAATGKELFRRALPEKYRGSFGYSFATSLAFLPGGDRLASGLMDSTVLIWDLEPRSWRSGLAVKDLTSRDLERLWTEIAGEDAATAYQAEWTLAAVPDKAVSFLKDHLHPVDALDTKQVQSLIADLDNPEFARREQAGKRLASFAERAEPALRRALEGKPSLEARKRLEALHTDAELASHGIVYSVELLRTLRAIRVLDHIGNRDAMQVLQNLAAGDPGARLTRQAKAALQRLERPSAKKGGR